MRRPMCSIPSEPSKSIKMQRSYISAVHDYNTDEIVIWERPIEGGERTMRRLKPPRYFYVPDENGEFTTINGVRVKKLEFESDDDLKAGKAQHKIRFESDVKALDRALMDEYYGVPTPVVNFALLDIEVDYNSKVGFSSPENPYAPINAITIYQSWTRTYTTYIVPPKDWKMSEVEFQLKIREAWNEYKLGFAPNVIICRNEKELLAGMLQDIEDADILSGWNSEFFDIPYIIKRLERSFGRRGLEKMSFLGAEKPRERIVKRYGSDATTYVLYGRTHLDYLDLFKKFTFEGRTSYSLANICAEELDIPKIEYDGTLEQLYNNDLVHFTCYNARDVEALVKLDDKFNFMQLVNQMAHENTVPFVAILGTVRYVETGIMNRAHNVHKLIVNDKVIPAQENEKVEGAIVLTPRAGLHEWNGSVDLTSLYPSVIRALNMSRETFVGQFKDEEAAWELILKKSDEQLLFVYDNGEEVYASAADWHEFIFTGEYCISAFGTVFDQSKPGMVADTLTFWFSERKRLQAEKKKYGKLAREETDPVKKAEYEKLEDHYDLLQLTKKIQLNSTYGALLNEAFRFGRREIGASVAGTGRQVTKHMGQTIGELVTGKPCIFEKRYAEQKSAKSFVEGEVYARMLQAGMYDQLRALPSKPSIIRKWSVADNAEVNVMSPAIWFTECDAIIYGDTDSCYFKTYANNYDDAVAVADEIARLTNESFPEFMKRSFNCSGGRENLMKAAREIVGERGLFQFAKKKYSIRVVNLDGTDLRAKPKLKSMGSEIKKADTPKAVQEFLKGLMDLILTGKGYSELEHFVNSARGTLVLKTEDLIALGTAKQVNNLDTFYAEWSRIEKPKKGKVRLPGHVRASINYNELATEYEETNAKLLKAGDKAIIFYLKTSNQWGFKSIALPADATSIPWWFNEHLTIDLPETEQKMIDNKIEGIFEAMQLEIPTPTNSYLNGVFSF